VVAELIAPQWTNDENRIVWPSKLFPDPNAQFTTEEFIAAVINDISKSRKIDDRFVFTLGWSSSGHVLYSASMTEPKVRGSIIAMSRFIQGVFPNLELARGKNYFLYQSPDDKICRFAEAQIAEQVLTEHGANVRLVSYPGGHGWAPNTPHYDRIKEGIEWLKGLNSPTAASTNAAASGNAATNQALPTRNLH
jgi:predicted esterase